jgi:hypothetical protein
VNQLWSSEAGTRPRANVTSAFMAPPTNIQSTDMKVRAPGYSVIHQVLLPLWFSRSPVHSCGEPPPIASLPLLVTSLILLFTCVTPLAWNSPLLPHLHCYPSIMPREHGKPKRGPLYYSFVARRNHPDPSQPLPPTGSPGRGQNWTETPPPSPHAQNLPPSPSENMHGMGSFPVEEEIPPPVQQPLNAPLEPSIITRPQARPMEHGSCMVEEEIPPSWLADWIAKNSSPGLDEEARKQKRILIWIQWKRKQKQDGKIEQTMPNPHRLSDDHLQLIFDMRRSLEEKTQNQCTLSPTHGPPVRRLVRCSRENSLSDLRTKVCLHLQHRWTSGFAKFLASLSVYISGLDSFQFC